MGIDRLQYFALVVETKNLRKAAEIAGISPGSMSKAIAVLASELGVELLLPAGRGIDITSAGMEVYRSSAPLLDEFRRFRLRAKGIGVKDVKRTLRIATFEVFSTHFLAGFLANTAFSDPVLLLEFGPGAIEQAIIDGLVDYGLTYMPAPRTELEFRDFGPLPFAIFGLEKWREVPFEQWPFAVPVTEITVQSAQFEALDRWPRGSKRRWIKYQFHQLEAALQTASNGLAVVHCPEIVVKLANQRQIASHQLAKLGHPSGGKPEKAPRAYLVGRKGEMDGSLERKIAHFLRLSARDG
jgi:DNA-binding transcriptional LysR family regulator